MNVIKLTEKQNRFCQEYVIDWNAKQAAIRAGYSVKTAHSIGSENLTKPEIQEQIKKVKVKLEEVTGISAARNLLELKKIAYADATQLRETWETIRSFEEIPDDVKASLQEIVYSETTFGETGFKKTIKVKQYSKIDAIKVINDMLGYNAPKRTEDVTPTKKLTLKEINDRLKEYGINEEE